MLAASHTVRSTLLMSNRCMDDADKLPQHRRLGPSEIVIAITVIFSKVSQYI
jgi:hypothetical protein